MPPSRLPAPAAPAVQGRPFAALQWADDAGRRCLLYRPARLPRAAAPLLVMLHGCYQDAEGFAAATGMNQAADEAGVWVLYPEQSATVHPLRCWNWYPPDDAPHGGSDEAAILAMTRQAVRGQRIDPARVYVAGLSAGGAMAAVLARTHPDVYAAFGVHSGLPAGMARNLSAALRLMSAGPDAEPAAAAPADGADRPDRAARIVFHGDGDTTVHPANAAALFGTRAPQRAAAHGSRTTTAACNGQRGYTRSVAFTADGTPQRELWMVHGAGHAWAGGNDEHPHTDARGPDASREMLRFLLQHRLAG